MKTFAIHSLKNCCQFSQFLFTYFKVKKHVFLFLTFLFLGTFVAFSQSFSGTGGAIADDNCPNTNDFIIPVTGIGVLNASNPFYGVKININHTYDDDLEISLFAPNGVSVLLSSDNGGSGNNFIDTFFTTNATTNITSGNAPFTGNYLPEGNFSNFNGVNANGNWTLKICDDEGQDVGQLIDWELYFGDDPCANPVNPSPSCNAFKVILVLDESGSIGDAGAEGQVEAATLALANVLIGTGAELAIVEFSSDSQIGSYGGYTNWNTVNQAYYNALAANIGSSYAPNGWTNWEAALDDVLALNDIKVADIVLFMTDGNPTAYINDSNGNLVTGANSTTSLNNALDESCEVKQDGSHIFMLGVGGGISIANLQAISGPILDDGPANPTLTPLSADYNLIGATDLTACFLDIAQNSCNNDLTLEKTVYAGHDNGIGCDGSKTIPNPNNSQVTYCFTITNAGQQTISNLDFSDSDINIDENDLTPVFQTSMTSGQSITYYYETTLPGNTTFPFLNTANVTGETPVGDPLSDSSQAEVTEPLCNPDATCNLSSINEEGCLVPQAFIDPNDVFSGIESCGATITMDYVDAGDTIICNDGDGADFTRTYTLYFDGVAFATCEQSITINDDTSPEVTCTEFSETFYGCADVISANTPTGEWITIGDDLGFLSAVGGIYSSYLDLSNCASDNCTSLGDLEYSLYASYEENRVLGCSVDIINEYSVRDACGNISDAKIVFRGTIIDNESPVAPSAPASVDVQCASDVPSAVDLTATDNCGDITVSPTEEITPGNCSNSFTIVRTWTFTDGCGNTSSVSQTINVNDTAAPDQPSAPASVDVQCASDVPAAVDLTAIDNCDGDITVSPTEEITPGNCANSFTIVRTWTFTDGCGNTSSVSQTINVNDTAAPDQPSAPASVDVQCASDVPAAVDLTAIDNCDGSITVSPTEEITPGECANSFTIVRTWTFTDGCGNTSSVSQTINVNDDTAPVITCPVDVALEAGTNLDTSPTATGTATGIDNCDLSPVITFNDVVVPGDCEGQLVITRTWTATDSCGNSSSCDQIINVGDDSPPVITCPADVELECADDLDTSPAATGTATATDSNDPNPVITFSDVISGSQSEPKLWINEFHYDNDGGDVGEFIEVAGTAGLDLSGYSIELYNGSNGTVYGTINLSGIIDDEGSGFGALSFLYSGIQNGGPDGFALINGTTLIEFLSYEGSFAGVGGVADGIISTDIGVIEVGSTPIGQSLQLTGSGSMSADFSWSEASVESPGSLNSNQTLISDSDNSCSDYIITRTWTATDDCGNSTSCDQIIEVKDTTAPVAPDAPADLNLQCADDVPAPIDLKALDACEGEINSSPTEEITPGNCANSFTIVRTWTFTDGCGNTSSVSQTINVNDDTSPEVTCTEFSETFYGCADDISANTPTGEWIAIGDDLGFLSAVGGVYSSYVDLSNCVSDNCTSLGDLEYSLYASYEENRVLGCSVDIINEYSVRDACGNISDAKIVFRGTIIDNESPVAPSAPANVDLQCASDVPAAVDLTATDNCGDITVSPTEEITPGNCTNSFTIVRTWIFTDGCGNTSSVSQTINVNDDTAPLSPEAPEGLDLQCASDVPAPVDLTAVDNCDGDITVSPTEEITPGECANSFTMVRTWTFTDGCGNTSSVSQTIKVNDDTAPVITCPVGVALEAGPNLDTSPTATGTATGIDNCDLSPVITFNDVVVPGDCEGQLVITRTWTATDSCGNSSSCDQIINVGDDSPPVITCPADVELECADDLDTSPATTGTATATDSNDPNPVITFSDVVSPGNCSGNYIITRTWKATDDCGNSVSCDQVIEVKDTTAPMAPQAPADLNLQCASDVPLPMELKASDACEGEISVSPSSVITPGECVNSFTMVRTWTFTDGCGNTSSVSQTINVNDDTAPVAPEAPEGLDLQCASDVPAPVELTAVDNCDGDITVSPSSVITPGECANSFTMVRTWTFTDSCGNTSSISQTINVNDDIAPDAPNAPADVMLCVDDEIPAPVDLTAVDNCDGNITVSPTENIVQNESGYVLTRTWTFTDGCENTSSVNQVITVYNLPEFTYVGEPECTDYAQSYTVTVEVSEGDVTSDYGNPIDNGNNSWTISDIPKDTNVTLTVTNLQTDCDDTIIIEAPKCICIELEYDYTNVTCNGLDDGTITVNFVTEGATVTINGQPYDENMEYAPGLYTIMAFFNGVDIDECVISEVIEITEPEHVSMTVEYNNVTCYGANDGTITVSDLSDGAVYTIQLNGYGPDLSGQTTFGPGEYLVIATLDTNDSGRYANDDIKNSRYDDPCIEARLITISQPDELSCIINANQILTNGIYCGKQKSYKLSVDTFGGEGEVSLLWELDDNAMNNGWQISSNTGSETIQFVAGTGVAVFSVIVTDENGCISECSIQLNAKCKQRNGGGNQVNNNFGYRLYPNPVRSQLQVDFDEPMRSSEVNVEVFNLVGTVMYSKNYKNFNGDKLTIDFSKFDSQVYYLKISTNQGTEIKKVVLDK